MDCTALSAEIASNSARIGDLGREDGSKVAQNVAMGTLGLFVPVLWLGMDFQDASGKEGKALRDRNNYLATLATQRCARITSAEYTVSTPRVVASSSNVAPLSVEKGALPDRIGLSPYPVFRQALLVH